MSKKLTVVVEKLTAVLEKWFTLKNMILFVVVTLIVSPFILYASIKFTPRYKKSIAWDYAVETNNETCKMLIKDYYEDEAFESKVEEYTRYLLDVRYNEIERDEAKEAEFIANRSQYAVDTCRVVIVNY